MSNLLNLFGKQSQTLRFDDGGIIFVAGDPGKTMYVVLEGSVEIVRGETLIESIPPGGMFGEMALVDSGPRSADAIARGATVLAPVDERRFMFLVQETPFFALHVMSVMAQRLRRRMA